MPYMYIWGAYKKYLQDNPPRGKTALMQIVGESPCRNAIFSLKDKVSLAKMGFADKVSVGEVDPFVTLMVGVKIILSVVSWDILHNLAAYHYAVESTPGEVDALYEEYCDEVEAVLQEKAVGPLAYLRVLRQWMKLRKIFKRAAADFYELDRGADPGKETRTVLISGDVYVRLDEMCNDNMLKRLAQYGLRMFVEPNILLFEYMAHIKTLDGFNIPVGPVSNPVAKNGMRILRHDLFSVVREKHPWLPMPDIAATVEKAKPYIGKFPRGEAPVTIGSVLHLWEEEACDGVILPSPWGCQPALVSEGVLRHRKDIPILYIYSDGSAIDERRIRSFAHGLKRGPQRYSP
ncbi:MAG: hypothetical protein GY859_01970 [Desulfobacterales bacterium]|nr:hypothetical protein [Desulfobacterales bacterium]